jgi:putative Holliday junction resolvase
MTILALDIGDKRIGIAVSDPSEQFPLPVDVIHRSNLEKDCKLIQKWVEEYQVRLVVAGLPRSLDGKIKVQAEKSITFVEHLKTVISVPVEFWNEWMTTKEAESVLISSNMRRENRKKVIDKLAATLILDGYLRRLQQIKTQPNESSNPE